MKILKEVNTVLPLRVQITGKFNFFNSLILAAGTVIYLSLVVIKGIKGSILKCLAVTTKLCNINCT